MSYGLYVSASGAAAQTRAIDVLANNLANADTVGFKQEFAVVKARHSEAIERGMDYQGSRSINDVGGGAAVDETVTDFSRGKVKHTGTPTDLLIDDPNGDTFFVVEREGKRLFTRAGSFHFSASGQLQTQQGLAVLSTSGEPVTIDPRRGWQIHEDGSVQQTGGDRTPLALEKPQSLGDLVKVGQNLFSSLASTVPVETTARRVRSGALEMSSVEPVQVMMDLIKANRAYEANVRLIQHQDSMIGNLVTRVLRQ